MNNNSKRFLYIFFNPILKERFLILNINCLKVISIFHNFKIFWRKKEAFVYIFIITTDNLMKSCLLYIYFHFLHLLFNILKAEIFVYIETFSMEKKTIYNNKAYTKDKKYSFKSKYHH